MGWQDFVLMAAGFLFAPALIPIVRSKAKPPRSSCIMTIIPLATICSIYITLELWLAAVAIGLNALMWGIILFQPRSPRRDVMQEALKQLREASEMEGAANRIVQEQPLEGLQLLYCKWCPLDCDLTREEKLGCLASRGFAEEMAK